MNINFMFYDFDLKIVNYVGGIIMENDLNQQIISNLRFSIFIKKFLILNKNTSITSIEIRVEPILFILGVGHLKTMKRFFDFLYYLYNWYYYGDKEDDKKNAEKEINLSKSVKKNISTKIIIPTNLLKFNYLMEVNLNLEKTKIQIFDNFEKYQCPLIICDFSNTFIKYLYNSLPYDVNNFVQALIEMLSNREPTDLNILNMFYYVSLKTLCEIKVFNEKFYNWEPVVEPMGLSIVLSQIDKISRYTKKLTCEKMIDLNISTNLIFVINKIMNKLNENSSFTHKNNNNFLDLNIKKTTHFFRKSINKSSMEIKNVLNNKENINLLEDDKKCEQINNKIYSDLVFNLRKKLVSNKNNGGDEKSFKLMNYLGVNLTFILLDQNNNFFPTKVSTGIKKKLHNLEISNIYFDMNPNYDIENKDRRNIFILYIDSLDYYIEHIDVSSNKISIYKIYPEIMNETIKSKYKHLIQKKAVNLYSDFYLEILVRTKFVKNVKIVIVESNINFYNNTNKNLRIAFVKKGSDKNVINNLINKNKYEKIEKPNEFENILVCNKKDHLRIPLNFILDEYQVYIGIVFCKFIKKEIDQNKNKIGMAIISNFNILTEELKENMSFSEYEEIFTLYSINLKFLYLLGTEYLNMKLENKIAKAVTRQQSDNSDEQQRSSEKRS